MNQYTVTITFKHGDDEVRGTELSADTAANFVFYAAIVVILLMIITLIVKLLRDIDGNESGAGETTATENSGLLSSKVESLFSTYGTSDEDLESGNLGSCSSISTTSDDELYDGKICVICYDDQRSCFFVPCGHCVTCNTCANRIISEELKTCPICRTLIDKVRKFQIL
ncbi:putative E3 ubiquitin ligase [Handroanthus impetiginosus]|uniref:Putative E3 ubiquitin ligase n=1 Tax=Handroanthus impetiginosus TaxID=429701 RepID=A0A2G9HLS3_9LAMI|nr:putative E3 ubiquitin ligase [Handroanthus impetiginosus]